MSLESIIEFLEEADNLIILGHHNADVDAICPAVVLRDWLKSKGKSVDIGTAESVSKVARRFVEKENVLIDPNVDKYSFILTLDTASPEQLLPIQIKDWAKVAVIDHHTEAKIATMAKTAWAEAEGKATAFMVYKLLKKVGFALTPRHATLLITGLVTDTGFLRMANLEIFEALVDLVKRADTPYPQILELLQSEVELSERMAVLKSLQRSRSYRVGDLVVTFSTVGSFESSVARNLLRIGSDVAVVAVPREGKVRISGRMNYALKGKLHLANDLFKPIEQIIGGSAGGHDAAGSANGEKPENISKAFDAMLKALEKKFGKVKEL